MKLIASIAIMIQLICCDIVEARSSSERKIAKSTPSIVAELVKNNRDLEKCFRSQGLKHNSLVLTIAFFQLNGRVRVPYMKVNHKGYRPIAFCIEKAVKGVKFHAKDEGKLHRYIFEYQKVSRKIAIRRQNLK